MLVYPAIQSLFMFPKHWQSWVREREKQNPKHDVWLTVAYTILEVVYFSS